MADQAGLSEEDKNGLARHMSSDEVADFTFSLYTHDADFRARTLLGISTDAPTIRGSVSFSEEDAHVFPFPGVDATYSELLGRFGNDAVRRSLVDPTTDEMCRLRNAAHQQCHF
jgi:hypothetical protein